MGVVDAKLTVSPELAVADRGSVDAANCSAVMVGKLMAWVALTTEKLRAKAAAEYVALPACMALMVQLPTASIEAVLPETEQLAGLRVEKVTGRPELAVALRVTLDWNCWLAITGKVTVCVA